MSPDRYRPGLCLFLETPRMDTTTLLLGILFGAVGLGYVAYAKNVAQPIPAIAGLGLMNRAIFYFEHSSACRCVPDPHGCAVRASRPINALEKLAGSRAGFNPPRSSCTWQRAG